MGLHLLPTGSLPMHLQNTPQVQSSVQVLAVDMPTGSDHLLGEPNPVRQGLPLPTVSCRRKASAVLLQIHATHAGLGQSGAGRFAIDNLCPMKSDIQRKLEQLSCSHVCLQTAPDHPHGAPNRLPSPSRLYANPVLSHHWAPSVLCHSHNALIRRAAVIKM